MHAVYYKKLLNIVLWAYFATTVWTHQRSQRTWKLTIAFTALSGSCFWSRHVLLSGPKLQNTNCTDKFSTAVMRHNQQTSGQLQTPNNTIVKGFFRFMSLVSVSFHQSCPSFDGLRSIDNTSRQVLLSKECYFDLHCNDSTNLLSLATSVNAYLMSILSIVNTDWTLQLVSLRLQPQSPIKLYLSDVRDLNFNCIQFSGFRS